ncbi:hypothetical protein SJAV_09380 [Sulfurisphaera javensis]|uniref:Uncharacterized protein n=1 Tax=Sulfurisphaera javensis TaxID=2049879 RepID=A0AAT9GQ99_9CREN
MIEKIIKLELKSTFSLPLLILLIFFAIISTLAGIFTSTIMPPYYKPPRSAILFLASVFSSIMI